MRTLLHALASIVMATAGLSQTTSETLRASPDEASRWPDETLERLSLEQKVGQMICEQMRGDYVASDSEQYLYWRRLARDYGVGGFVV